MLNRKLKMFCLFSLATTVFITAQWTDLSIETQTQSQTKINADGEPQNSDFILNAEVDGVVSRFDFIDNDFKTSLINQPFPELWMNFTNKQKNPLYDGLRDSDKVRIQ